MTHKRLKSAGWLIFIGAGAFIIGFIFMDIIAVLSIMTIGGSLNEWATALPLGALIFAGWIMGMYRKRRKQRT